MPLGQATQSMNTPIFKRQSSDSNRESSNTNYHSLKIKNDDMHMLVEAEMEAVGQTMFTALTYRPGALNEKQAHAEGAKLQNLNKKHANRHENVKKIMKHQENQLVFSARADFLIKNVDPSRCGEPQ
ncbi:Hypothetical predicted protein [Lecanosticta acicola]|uniref:Uncharacterized protein n=1 Tax=Lecanosticta acicola TaxID=111012 RepID=A0AAI8YU20_9PEZI|nr:Hypothetical predicted protein [Lecanosticta acicola]